MGPWQAPPGSVARTCSLSPRHACSPVYEALTPNSRLAIGATISVEQLPVTSQPALALGVGTVRLANGALLVVELLGYEAHGIGQMDMKIKRYLDES